MDASILPLEIFAYIALIDPSHWRDLLAIPDFGRWTLTRSGKKSRKDFLKCELIYDESENESEKYKIPWRIEYRLNGLLHNFDDIPALIYINETCEHCEINFVESPILLETYECGTRYIGKFFAFCSEWYQNSLLHRDDEPAVVYRSTIDGTLSTEEWWTKGKKIREIRK